MILGTLITSFGYLLTVTGYGAVGLLVLEWLAHYLPGAGWNPLRRVLFQALFPLLSFSQRYASFQWGGLDSRGLLPALGIWVVARHGVPWIVWAGFQLRG